MKPGVSKPDYCLFLNLAIVDNAKTAILDFVFARKDFFISSLNIRFCQTHIYKLVRYANQFNRYVCM